jgi:hypothetical protein
MSRALVLVAIKNGWPVWTFDDGSTEVTPDRIALASGRMAIAERAARLAPDWGTADDLFEYLGGLNGCIEGDGDLLPRDFTGLDDLDDPEPADRDSRDL